VLDRTETPMELIRASAEFHREAAELHDRLALMYERDGCEEQARMERALADSARRRAIAAGGQGA
jgi:hypothetical protein